jgi:hypothetical protein
MRIIWSHYPLGLDLAIELPFWPKPQMLARLLLLSLPYGSNNNAIIAMLTRLASPPRLVQCYGTLVRRGIGI